MQSWYHSVSVRYVQAALVRYVQGLWRVSAIRQLRLAPVSRRRPKRHRRERGSSGNLVSRLPTLGSARANESWPVPVMEDGHYRRLSLKERSLLPALGRPGGLVRRRCHLDGRAGGSGGRNRG